MRSPRSDLTMDFFVVAMALIGIAKDFYFLSLSLYNYKSLVQEMFVKILGLALGLNFQALISLFRDPMRVGLARSGGLGALWHDGKPAREDLDVWRHSPGTLATLT